jgi:hypothetical protein
MALSSLFVTLAPLEIVSHYAPLGIRFWDLARDVVVTDGLAVSARPPGRPDLERAAFQTLSGIYAFRNLPGLRSLEVSDPALPAGVHPLESSPPQGTRFVVTVVDRLQRFLPVTFAVDLPYRGIYPTQPGAGGGDVTLPGFFLFSAPSRTGSAGLAAVQAQLVERLGDGSLRRAAYAVLEVEPAGQPAAQGIADEHGSALVLFPYPPFATTAGSVSPPPGPPETRIQAWDVTIRVRYRLAFQSMPDAGARLPDLGSILNQPAALLVSQQGGIGQPDLLARLVFGQPLVVQTEGISDLWLES